MHCQLFDLPHITIGYHRKNGQMLQRYLPYAYHNYQSWVPVLFFRPCEREAKKDHESVKKKRERKKRKRRAQKQKAQIRAYSSLPHWKPGSRAQSRSAGGKAGSWERRTQYSMVNMLITFRRQRGKDREEGRRARDREISQKERDRVKRQRGRDKGEETDGKR